MIAFPKSNCRDDSTRDWQNQFLLMLPRIVTHARIAFRDLDSAAKDDAVTEVVANAFVAFARLVELSKADLAFASVLARYGVAQFRAGRRVGGRLNIRDTLSRYAQQRKGFSVERLDRYDEEEGVWQEAVVQDTRIAPVSDVVAFRCDFAAWLDDLPSRNRHIAEALAMGHSTGEVAKRFDVSPGRVSQLRRELHESWGRFQGER